MNKQKVILERNGKKYGILNIGYDKGGGYFLVDLSSTEKDYFITKIKMKLSGFGRKLVPIDDKNQWITSYKPKLMHHIDGTTHISGSRVRSGFYKTTKTPKGVATSSPNFNDGGPIFTFLFWGLEKFDTNGKSGVIFKEKHILDKYLGLETEAKNDGYVFEGFFLPHFALSRIDLSEGVIPFKHPNFGIIPLKYIPPPPNSPGFIALSCRRTSHGFKSDHGFSYGGGASIMDEDGYTTGIQVIYPFEGEFRRTFEKEGELKNLHYTLKYKIIYKFDDFFYKILQKIDY